MVPWGRALRAAGTGEQGFRGGKSMGSTWGMARNTVWLGQRVCAADRAGRRAPVCMAFTGASLPRHDGRKDQVQVLDEDLRHDFYSINSPGGQ